MTAATENIRKLPGDLEFLTPQCPICAEYTDPVDAGFDCCECGVTWDERGENPQRIDPDAVQCPSLYAPRYLCADPEYGHPDAEVHRCWRDAGHGGMHCNPESFYDWSAAEQASEAEEAVTP